MDVGQPREPRAVSVCVCVGGKNHNAKEASFGNGSVLGE